MDEKDQLLADFTTAFAHSLAEVVRAMSVRPQRFTTTAIGGDVRRLANSLQDITPRAKSLMLQIAEEIERTKTSGKT